MKTNWSTNESGYVRSVLSSGEFNPKRVKACRTLGRVEVWWFWGFALATAGCVAALWRSGL